MITQPHKDYLCLILFLFTCALLLWACPARPAFPDDIKDKAVQEALDCADPDLLPDTPGADLKTAYYQLKELAKEYPGEIDVKIVCKKKEK